MLNIGPERFERYILKYFLIVVGVIILRMLLQEAFPGWFMTTVGGEGSTHTMTSFFGLYQKNFFNLVPAAVMAADLQNTGKNRVIIPLLTMISLTAGLFFFSVLIFENLADDHEKI